jgi:hypothetical protein
MEKKDGIYKLRIADKHGAAIWANGAPITVRVARDFSPYYRRLFGPTGIHSLCGQRVLDTAESLFRAIDGIDALTDVEDALRVQNWNWDADNQWTPTLANAKAALQALVVLGSLAPSGIWWGEING